MKKLIIVALGILVLCPGLFTGSFAYAAKPTGGAGTNTFETHPVTIPLRFDYYYTYGMVVEALQKLNKAYPKLTKLELVGKSEEGRAIYCLILNNPKTGKMLDKPGIWVDANIHGNEIQGGEVALYMIQYLLEKYGENEQLTQLVNKKCFYFAPVINPDGRYHFMTDPNDCNDNRSLRRPHDDDGDGLFDEDYPDDLDGDGNICMMRKKDPFGHYKTDPNDPRLMVRIKPGEKGEWRVFYTEGIDNDGDGRLNEDSQGYVDPNRNFGYDWQPNYVEQGAGDYPFSGVGIRAIGKYIKAHTNICMAWTWHNYGGLFVRGPSSKAWGPYHPEDTAVFDYLGEQGERIVPGYKYVISYKDMYTTYGDMDGWFFKSIGAYAFTGELYWPESESFKSLEEAKAARAKEKAAGEEDTMSYLEGDNSFERERLKFNDYVAHGELFRPWKPLKHPTYGDIEIGGWVKISTRLCHPFMLKDMVHRNAAAMIFSAQQTPEISMEIFEIKKTGNNVYRVRTRLKNAKAIPTMTHHAQQVKLYPQDTLKVSGKGIKVIAGGKLTDEYRDNVSYKDYRPGIQFFYVPGFGKVDHQFLISGAEGSRVTFSYHSFHGGKITQTITLK